MDVTVTTTSAHAHALQVDEKERPPLQTPSVRHHELDRGAHQTLDAAWGGEKGAVQMGTKRHVTQGHVTGGTKGHVTHVTQGHVTQGHVQMGTKGHVTQGHVTDTCHTHTRGHLIRTNKDMLFVYYPRKGQIDRNVGEVRH